MNDVPIIIIIGTGLAGYTLAKELRKLDAEQAIVLLSEDDGHFYSKPLLSTGLAKGKDVDELIGSDRARMADELKLDIRPFSRVRAINPERRQLELDGQSLNYRQLVLATGAVPLRLDIPGFDSPGVMAVNNLADYRAFRQRIEGKQRLLIMGAGLIGCEFANDLLAAGKSVTLVHPFAAPLSGLVPEPAGQALRAGLERAGAVFELGKMVSAIAPHGDGLRVQLSDGRALETDLVLSAVGLAPRIDLAQAAGIACRRGICTDSYLATDQPDIYALGDCAEVEGEVRLYVLPLMQAARALAQTLSGTPTAVHYPLMPVMSKTPACPVIVLPPQGEGGSWQLQGEALDVRGEYRDAQAQLQGFVLTGSAVAHKQALLKAMADAG